MTSHVLSVNSAGIVRTLRNQFTRSTAFLPEALQNARRAGATTVRVLWDERSRIMRITDDGNGIKDFEALFTLGRSGWDAEVLAEENPFGVGFMSAVLASSHLTIRSGDRQASFDSRTLLNFEPIEITPISGRTLSGTELVLTLQPAVTPPPAPGIVSQIAADHWQHLLCTIAAGFPIPIYFNDQLIPRPLAIDSEFIATDVGQVRLNDYALCKPFNLQRLPRLYYQGLPVVDPSGRRGESPDVLHLDQQRFRLRMPDRDTLIDAHQQSVLIHEVLEAVWRKRLIERRSELTPQDFVDFHWTLCNQLKLPELLQDMPLSASMISRYTAPLDLMDDSDAELERWSGAPLPGKDAVFIERVSDDYSAMQGDSPAPLASVYALVRSLPVLDARVPEIHWSRRRVVDVLDQELGLSYELKGARKSGEFRSKWVACTVMTCDSYTISFRPTPSCEVSAKLHQQLIPVAVDNQVFFDADTETLVVPSKAQNPGDALRQVCPYRDEWESLHDDDFENDCDGVNDLVASLRSRSPHDYLESFLRQLRLDPKLLGKKTFAVRFDPKAKRLIVERGAKRKATRNR